MLLECCGLDPLDGSLRRKGTDETENSYDKTLECDYDQNPTTLYQAIQDEAWEAALQLLTPQTGRWKTRYKEGETPEEQVRTWVSRHEENGDLRWSQLPLHAAIIFGAPLELVQRLIEIYPDGLKSKDDQGMLPFHLAFRYGSSDDIVYLLLEEYPNAVNVKGRKGRFPLECARTTGPQSKRTVIIQAFVEKVQKEMESRMTRGQKETEEKLGSQVTELEDELEEAKMQIAKLKKENEILNYAASTDAVSSDKNKVKELQRHVDVLNAANKMLAMSEQEAKAELNSHGSDRSNLSARRSTASNDKPADTAEVVVQLAQAEAEAMLEKKENAEKSEAPENAAKEDRMEEKRRSVEKDEEKEPQGQDEPKSPQEKKSGIKKSFRRLLSSKKKNKTVWA